MKKFELNDYVTYTNKVHGIRITGPIIAMSYDNYIIAREENDCLPHWRVRERSLDAHSYSTRIESEFRDVLFGLRSKREVCIVGRGSKNINSATLRYDPSQQGDRDDDI